MTDKSFRPSLRTIQSSYYGKATNTFENSGITEKIGDFLGTATDRLPMYKDKPDYPSRSRKRSNGTKYGALALFLLCILWLLGLLPVFPGSSSASGKGGWFSINSNVRSWHDRREAVRQAFITTWDNYAEHAWGMDQYHPVSQKGSNMGCKPGAKVCPPVGWIIVDSLDTAIMMNLTSRVAQAREWISTSLDYSKPNSEMNTFESTIRLLGGLLSAHYLSTSFPTLAPQADDDVGAKGEDLYIEKAVDLADRLLGAFDTASGVPLSSCIFNTSQGHQGGGPASTSEATTVQMEMKYVSKLTGEPFYWEKAEKIMAVVDAPRREGGLLPIYIDAHQGTFSGNNIRLGSRGDSYYEYLIKQYLQTGSREDVYLEMWEEALEGVKKYLITWSEHANFTILGELQSGIKGGLTPKMDHLVCFLPGTIALGVTHGSTIKETKQRLGAKWTKKYDENIALAEELMKTCWGMYAVTPTGLAPEIAYLQRDPSNPVWNFDDPDWTMPRSAELTSGADAEWRDDYDIKTLDRHNLQRPEAVESLFYMWRITGDVKYREWGWEMFQAFVKHTAVYDEAGNIIGYTSIDDVYDTKLHPVSSSASATAPKQVGHGSRGVRNVKRDNLESFWLAETLKYFYLLFSDEVEEWNDLRNVVINTEAHIFPRFDIGEQGPDAKGPWKTGWSRKARASS